MKNRRALLGSAVLGLAALSFSATKSYGAIAYALTDENDLLVFDTSAPDDLIRGGVITGLLGQDLIGIDFRPSNSVMYAVGNLGGIYTINPTTFAATQVGALNIGGVPFALSGSRFGFDFNPVADRLRIISDTEQSIAVDVTTGGVTVNADLAYGPGQPGATGDNPNVTGAAYTNILGGGTTTLYDIDVRSTEDRLVTQVPATGVLTVVGSLNIDVSALGGFDITQEGPNNTNTAYAALQQVDGGIHRLYSINLNTGAATLLGPIGGGDLIDGLTIAPVPEPASMTILALGALGLCARRRRQA